jgi:hypothetical protein
VVESRGCERVWLRMKRLKFDNNPMPDYLTDPPVGRCSALLSTSTTNRSEIIATFVENFKNNQRDGGSKI